MVAVWNRVDQVVRFNLKAKHISGLFLTPPSSQGFVQNVNDRWAGFEKREKIDDSSDESGASEASRNIPPQILNRSFIIDKSCRRHWIIDQEVSINHCCHFHSSRHRPRHGDCKNIPAETSIPHTDWVKINHRIFKYYYITYRCKVYITDISTYWEMFQV